MPPLMPWAQKWKPWSHAIDDHNSKAMAAMNLSYTSVDSHFHLLLSAVKVSTRDMASWQWEKRRSCGSLTLSAWKEPNHLMEQVSALYTHSLLLFVRVLLYIEKHAGINFHSHSSSSAFPALAVFILQQLCFINCLLIFIQAFFTGVDAEIEITRQYWVSTILICCFCKHTEKSPLIIYLIAWTDQIQIKHDAEIIFHIVLSLHQTLDKAPKNLVFFVPEETICNPGNPYHRLMHPLNPLSIIFHGRHGHGSLGKKLKNEKLKNRIKRQNFGQLFKY